MENGEGQHGSTPRTTSARWVAHVPMKQRAKNHVVVVWGHPDVGRAGPDAMRTHRGGEGASLLPSGVRVFFLFFSLLSAGVCLFMNR